MRGIGESFNLKSYKAIAKQPFGKALKFFIIFIAIISAIISLKTTLFIRAKMPQFSAFLNKNLEYFSSDFPEIEIKDGGLVSPVQPYIKEWQNKFAFIVEPKAEEAVAALEKYENALFLGRNKLVLKTTEPRSDKSRMEIYKLEKIGALKIIHIPSGLKIIMKNGEMSITPESFKKFFRTISFLLWPLFFVCLFVVYCFTKTIQILFFSLFSLAINAQLKASLTFKELLNIGCYALVPPTSLAVIKESLNIEIPGFSLIYSLVYMIYLFQGIKVNIDAPPAVSS